MKKSKKNKKQIRRKKVKKSKNTTLRVIPDFSKSSDHLLFSMIGANYLISNYEEGTWTPIFELEEIFSLEQQQGKIAMEAYSKNEEKIDPSYLIPCSWVMLPSEVKKNIYDQLVNDYGTDFLNGERNLEVWEFFNEFKTLISNFVSENQII